MSRVVEARRENVRVVADPAVPPIRLVVRDDDLRRSRLTVFFRLLLALPHLVWLGLWAIAASVAAFVLWLAILIEGRAPPAVHGFVTGYVRYATHVGAYVFLAAGPFPGFRGAPGYPIDVDIDPPARQSRWSALVRIVLVLPAILVASGLGGGFAWAGLGGIYAFFAFFVAASGAVGAAAFLTWFSALVRGRAPRGLRDLVAFALGYSAQAGGYALFLTGRYPSSDPALAEPYSDLPAHPVRSGVSEDLARPLLVVRCRALLALPHLVWLVLWGIAVLGALLAAWAAALVTGSVPSVLHRFLAAYVRYAMHVTAFVTLVGRRFPGFAGRAGSYEVDLELPAREPQPRLATLARLVLAIPALLVANALGTVAWIVAFLGWWYALVRGTMPEGLRNLGASCLRYTGQTYAYLFLVTKAYPYAAPVLRERPPAPAPEIASGLVPGDAF